MRGTVHLTVRSARLKYEMDFRRNITVIKGDSATGKTTLVDMINEYNLNGTDTGIELSCTCPCRVIAGSTWKEQLAGISGSLVFIDEGNRFVSSVDFAHAIRETDNYYVLVTRESLYALPYSVTEIYGIHSAGKYAYPEPVYHEMFRIYGDYDLLKEKSPGRLIAEDSNAGYEFFSALLKNKGIVCESANGAGNIYEMIQKAELNDHITVVADGAAFGANMEKVYQVLIRKPGIQLYLPESFEWLILSSGALQDNEVKSILDDPSAYIESRDYFSWERYFTQLLISRTKDTYMKYSKASLNPVFLQGRICEQIVSVLPDLLRDAITV